MWLWVAAAFAECLVVHGTTPEGAPQGVRIEDGVIRAVGAKVSTAGCTVAKVADDVVLTPGVVQVNSSLGVAEVDMEDGTVDNAGDGDEVRSSWRVTDAYNPRSTRIPVVRLGGITSAVVVPHNGLIAGQAGWVRLSGATQAESVVNASVAMMGSVHGHSKAQQLDRMAELLDDVRAYEANRSKVKSGDFRALTEGASVRELEALIPVVRGTLPLVLGANRASDIEAILRLAKEQSIRVVIKGAAEGWLVREALAAAKTPVIVDAFVYGAGQFGEVHGRPDNPALLAEAGVTVLFSSWTHNAPLATQQAGNAVRGGMSKAAALDAITINPAIAFGVTSHTGLEVGNAGDLVAWTGDPLEIGSHPALIVVNGVVQPLDSRQRALFRKYRTLPGTPLPALSVEP